ncbi:hypothetical protein GY21_08195 [Cryobacterium roopkundense]|uniref:Tight adherence protein B n=1 Tax=Cryobacterium roopkundense TaxID=1001240 RepID=A0A099JGI4_9MICO|nr:type II secretion system F family protein [Cryobacterium roopkundense]KGJ77130.1 hypothetical protein GY21_08195 [Cryobacterium roopkundense]MBB5641499.1 tight adherence protein B [Cryobacterium roopkundense]
MLVYAGYALALLAMLVVVFVVVWPPAPRVSLSRRRAVGAVHVSQLSRVTDRTVSMIDGVISRRRATPFDAARLEQANIRMNPPSFMLMVLCAAVVLAGCGMLVAQGVVATVVLMGVFAALSPVGASVLLSVRTSRRRARFANQLDDTLMFLAGGLRSGHSLLRVIDAVSHEAEEPSSQEFARVVNETRLGRDLTDALEATAVRMRNEDFQWVAQAIAINREVGGRLSDVFDQVGRTIRERNQIRRQVSALSAEGKMSAWVLLLLPVGVFLFLLLAQPTYFAGFFVSIWGYVALVVAVVLMAVGSMWMMAAVRVKF